MIHSWTDNSMSGRLIFSCINSLIYNLKLSRLLVSCISPSNFPLILFNNPLWKGSWKACQQFQLNVLRLKALLRRKLLFNFELYYQNKTADLFFWLSRLQGNGVPGAWGHVTGHCVASGRQCRFKKGRN